LRSPVLSGANLRGIDGSHTREIGAAQPDKSGARDRIRRSASAVAPGPRYSNSMIG
jgi:hypothetical protein